MKGNKILLKGSKKIMKKSKKNVEGKMTPQGHRGGVWFLGEGDFKVWCTLWLTGLKSTNEILPKLMKQLWCLYF